MASAMTQVSAGGSGHPSSTGSGFPALMSPNNPGTPQLIGGVEEVSGMTCPAIATLDRQYESPMGQRILVFLRTNPNCGLQGGVETILKLQKSKSRNNSNNNLKDMAAAAASGDATGEDLDYTYNSSRRANKNNNHDPNADPYAFLREDQESHGYASDTGSSGTGTGSVNSSNANAAAMNTNKQPKGGPNLGRFLKKVAKQTTGALERGMHELAIKADQGRNPDLLTACLFLSTGELVAMTDSVPMPRISAGVSFHIPLWVPPRVDDASQVTIKLYIHSQASLMALSATGKPKPKHFLLGQTQVSVGQMRQLLLQQRKGFFSLPLASTLVADGQLHFCVLPDLKLPTLGQRGWSLIDPRFSGFVTGLYNAPLDQSYFLPTPSPWLIATERAMESTVVLPLAAAFGQICADACGVSLQHASAITTLLLAKRTEQNEPGPCARVQLHLQYLQLDATAANPSAARAAQLPSVTLTLAWQPPDSIFELELLPSFPIPVGSAGMQQQQQQQPSLQFFPAMVTTGILPAILKAFGGRLPPAGFMLGNLRIQIAIPPAVRGQPIELWETNLILEQHANTNTALQLPLYSLTTGHMVGSLALNLNVQLEQPTEPLPQPMSPKRGLVAMVGLENLVDAINPTVDFTVDAPTVILDSEAKRRHQQLATMGSFMSHAYLDQHVKSRRQLDLELLQQRAQQYRGVLDRHLHNSQAPSEPIPSWEDKSPKPFRASSSRPEFLLSAIPFNTHNASFSLDIMDPSNHGTAQSDGALFHNITCGAPADHVNGFGNVFVNKTFTSPIGSVSGGLRRLEAKRQELGVVVKQAQTQLTAGVAEFFQAARQQQPYLNHVPARHSSLQNLRWKVFEAMHAYHHVTWICAIRRASAFSQALGIAVSSYLTSLSDIEKCQKGWPQLWARHGYLVSFEGLLSAAGKELGMIEDASVAISMLHMVRIVLVPDDGTNSNVPSNAVPIPHSPLLKWVHLIPSTPDAGGVARTHYLVQIGVHAHYYEQRVPPCLQNGTQVQLFPVLFQVGVDIRQWGANAGSNMKSQFAGGTGESSAGAASGNGGLLDDDDDDVGVSDDDVLVALNYEALQKMNAYAHLLSPVPGSPVNSGNPFDAFVETQSSAQQANSMSVHPSLSMLHSHIRASAGKMNHSILDEAATIAQQLGGGGVVFCKSGKDRTAMHVTYKQAQFANRFREQRYNNPEMLENTLEDATRMRIYGTRLPICEKNVGQALYAFNSLQSKFMPDALKPPPSTLAGFLKGGRVFGGGGIET